MVRFFKNPYEDYKGQPVQVNEGYVRNLINKYKELILNKLHHGNGEDGVYVGDAGISYMCIRLAETNEMESGEAIGLAKAYIDRAKQIAKPSFGKRGRKSDMISFYCGHAGIFGISAAIAHMIKDTKTLQNDLDMLNQGFEDCKSEELSHVRYNELLYGRAGFLGGIYFLNRLISPQPFSPDQIIEICRIMVESGRKYSSTKRCSIPLMYEWHGTEYLGGAHGLSTILLMLLESPWFSEDPSYKRPLPADIAADIKNSIDAFLALQDPDGNFPVALGSERERNQEKRLVHWCHGAPGVIYLFLRAYKIYKEEKYLTASKMAADLIWTQGLLRKGPGICHGVAGNAYAFLVLYKVTQEPRDLYRTIKFAEFLSSPEFNEYSSTPDRPYSLYEGIAGTVCFLVDLLHIDQANFPFLSV